MNHNTKYKIYFVINENIILQRGDKIVLTLYFENNNLPNLNNYFS